MNDQRYNNARTIAQTILRNKLGESNLALERSDIETAVHSALQLLARIIRAFQRERTTAAPEVCY
jgi:hypothetical protein